MSFDDAVREAGLDPDFTPVDVAFEHPMWALAELMTNEDDE